MNAGSFRSWERSWLTASKETETSPLQPQGIKLYPQLDLIYLGRGGNLEAFLIQEFWGHMGDVNIDNIQQVTGWRALVGGNCRYERTKSDQQPSSLSLERRKLTLFQSHLAKFQGIFFQKEPTKQYSLSIKTIKQEPVWPHFFKRLIKGCDMAQRAYLCTKGLKTLVQGKGSPWLP